MIDDDVLEGFAEQCEIGNTLSFASAVGPNYGYSADALDAAKLKMKARGLALSVNNNTCFCVTAHPRRGTES